MLHAVIPPEAHGTVALWRGARVVVARLGIALHLAHVRAAPLVSTHVVPARAVARFDGLRAGDAAGPTAGVLGAVWALMAARFEAALGGSARMLFTCVSGG